VAQNRHEDQWYRIKDPDINPHSCTYWFLAKAHKTYNGEDSHFNRCSWENWIHVCRNLKLDPCFSPCKYQSKVD
jgi:hypothetical protein